MAATDGANRKQSSSRGHRGLGRGLGALIGTEEPAPRNEEARPVDILFPPSTRRTSSNQQRESSAKTRELLTSPLRKSGKQKSVLEQNGTRSSRISTGEIDAPGTLVSASAEASERVALGPNQPDTSSVLSGMSVSFKPDRSGSHRADVSRETLENASEVDSLGDHEDVSRETLKNTSEDHRTTPSQALEEGRAETEEPELVPIPGVSFAEIPTDQVIANTRQPREVFDPDELAELAASIKEVGVLQPVVVRPIDIVSEPSEALRLALEDRPNARFELVMGERRLRASELAEKETIPAIIRRTEDGDLLRDALLENLHRAQLNPLEEANAYQQLMADFGATQEQLSVKIARSRPQIANTLRLLKLPPSVQRKVAAGVISAGHARALLGLSNTADIETLADRVVAEGLSVRTTEELVKLGHIRRPVTSRKLTKPTPSAVADQMAHVLSDRWDTRVTVSEGKRKGKIVIEFAGPEDLERLAALMIGNTEEQ